MTEPQIIAITENQEKFKYIYCCCYSSFAIITNGLLFSWGGNNGILGQGVNELKSIPRKVKLFNAQKICADYENSYFLTNEGTIYFCNKTQNTPKIIRKTFLTFSKSKRVFTDLELNYCCDKNIFYKLKKDKLEEKGEFDSFNEFLAKELKITSKMIYNYDESENSNKCEFSLKNNPACYSKDILIYF